jgi:LysM repeat protein
MVKKIKLLLVISMTTTVIGGCTPANTNNNTNSGITHTHNGIAHTHPLPIEGLQHVHNIGTSKPSQTCQPCANNNANNRPVNNQIIKYQPPNQTTTTYTSSTNLPNDNTQSYYQPAISPPLNNNQPSQPSSNCTPTNENDYCGSINSSSIINNSSCNTTTGNYYIVKPKDGIYRIGVNNGIKLNDIIRLNNLQSPDYTIHPGQCLRLR